MAYADDVDLMKRAIPGLNEAFLNLEKSARNMGLIINQGKTLYMHSGKDTTLHQDLAIGNYMFKGVDSFKYLGRMVNKMNNRSVEVNDGLPMANRAYYGLQNHMKSRIMSRNIKTLLYRGSVRSTRGLGPTMTARGQSIGISIGMLAQTLIMSITVQKTSKYYTKEFDLEEGF